MRDPENERPGPIVITDDDGNIQTVGGSVSGPVNTGDEDQINII